MPGKYLSDDTDLVESVGETPVERTRRRLTEFNALVAKAQETTPTREARETTIAGVVNSAHTIKGKLRLPEEEV